MLHFSDWDIVRIEHRLRCGLPVSREVLDAAAEQIVTTGIANTRQLELDLEEAEQETESAQERAEEAESLADVRLKENAELEKENTALKAKAAELEELKAAGAKFLSLCAAGGAACA